VQDVDRADIVSFEQRHLTRGNEQFNLGGNSWAMC
jgi:hypothetical protein